MGCPLLKPFNKTGLWDISQGIGVHSRQKQEFSLFHSSHTHFGTPSPPPPRLWMCGTSPPPVITRRMAITLWHPVLTPGHTKGGIYLTSDIALKRDKTHFSLNIWCVCVCVCVRVRAHTWMCKKHFSLNFCVHMCTCTHTGACTRDVSATYFPNQLSTLYSPIYW
jgi:hypothetical protein